MRRLVAQDARELGRRAPVHAARIARQAPAVACRMDRRGAPRVGRYRAVPFAVLRQVVVRSVVARIAVGVGEEGGPWVWRLFGDELARDAHLAVGLLERGNVPKRAALAFARG